MKAISKILSPTFYRINVFLTHFPEVPVVIKGGMKRKAMSLTGYRIAEIVMKEVDIVL